jgi:hypothetical protein
MDRAQKKLRKKIDSQLALLRNSKLVEESTRSLLPFIQESKEISNRRGVVGSVDRNHNVSKRYNGSSVDEGGLVPMLRPRAKKQSLQLNSSSKQLGIKVVPSNYLTPSLQRATIPSRQNTSRVEPSPTIA